MTTSRGAPGLRRLATDDLTPDQAAAIRRLMDDAFGNDEDERFTDDDWAHALGGVHYVLDIDGEVVGHAAVVERELYIDGVPLRTGYVEAVAVRPDKQGRGLGSVLMTAVSDDIRGRFELGALGTGRHRFYERLGWQTWQGPSFVRTSTDEQRTRDEDGFILVLETPASPPLDRHATISCEWRPGDVW